MSCANADRQTRCLLLGGIHPIGERVAMKRGMLPDIGPAAGRIAGRRRGGAIGRDILPGVVAGNGREGPLAAFEVLQQYVAGLYLARRWGAQRLEELLAMTGHRAVDADDVDEAGAAGRSANRHLFRE